MPTLRKPTTAETVTLWAILAVFAGMILIPDSATSTRWGLERRAQNWTPTIVPALADQSLLATDVELAGKWSNHHRLTRSSFAFSKTSDRGYDADFITGGCLGGCRLSRTASVQNGVVTLDRAVAEYILRTYNTLYAVRIDGQEYQVPAYGIQTFEQQLAFDSDGWKWHVFSRDDESTNH